MAIKGTVKIFKVLGLEILRVEEYHRPGSLTDRYPRNVAQACPAESEEIVSSKPQSLHANT